jgi:outer membrane protein TolC
MRAQDPVDKRFPFPGILALKGQIADQQVRAAREDLEIARRNALTDARQAYWKLGFVHAAREIADSMLGLLDRLESVATARYESGKTSFQDLAKVRIQKSTLEERLVSLRERQRTLETKILELVDLPPLARIGRPQNRAAPRDRYDLETLYDLASGRRQELRRMRADIARLERMIELVETRILPGFSMNFSIYENVPALQAGTAAQKEGFPVSTQASVGAGLPKTPWYGTNDAYLRQVRLKHQALQFELEQAEAETYSQVRSAWFELDKAQREARLYRETVVGLSEAALEAATRGYEAGNVTFADVFNSYTLMLDAHLSLAEAVAAAGTAKAGLEKAVGASF